MISLLISTPALAIQTPSLIGRWESPCTAGSRTLMRFSNDQTTQEAILAYDNPSCSGNPQSVVKISHSFTTVWDENSGSSGILRLDLTEARGNTPKAREYAVAVGQDGSLKLAIRRFQLLDGSVQTLPKTASQASAKVFLKSQTSRSLRNLLQNHAATFFPTRIHEAIEKIRASREFPKFTNAKVAEPTVLRTSLPSWFASYFRGLNKFVFGNFEEMQLAAHAERGNAICLMDKKEVYIDPEFGITLDSTDDALKRRAIEFVLAHELSHYLHQHSIEMGASKRSPHGLESTVGVLPPAGESIARGEILKKILEFGRRHAEVDAFAMSLLESIGSHSPLEILSAIKLALGASNPKSIGWEDDLDFVADEELLLLERVIRLYSAEAYVRLLRP